MGEPNVNYNSKSKKESARARQRGEPGEEEMGHGSVPGMMVMAGGGSQFIDNGFQRGKIAADAAVDIINESAAVDVNPKGDGDGGRAAREEESGGFVSGMWCKKIR